MSTVKNIKITNIRDTESWKKNGEKYRRFMPQNLKPQNVQFELHGFNVAVANGLRRALLEETLIKGMNFELGDFNCSYKYMISDVVHGRIRNIPLRQSTPIDVKFELNITNDTETRIKQVHDMYKRVERDYGKLTKEEQEQKKIDLAAAENPDIMYVLVGDLVQTAGKKLNKLPFNETFELGFLEPGTSMVISTIVISEGYGYDHAGFAMVSKAAATPMDQEPFNSYTGKGISCSVSDPRIHLIKFQTNGIMDPYKMVVHACNNIEERVGFVREIIPEFKLVNDIHTLDIKDESDTLANLIVKTMADTENVELVTYKPDDFMHGIILRIKTSADVSKIMERVLGTIVDDIKKIKKAFAN